MSVTEPVPMGVLPPAETHGRSAVYRIFDGGQQLLYVGSTSRPRQRWFEHKCRTAWWPQARQYSLTWLPSRDAAYEAEALAIAAERPVFNQVWQPEQIPSPRKGDSLGEEVRRVTDALNAVEQIADREERIRAKSKVMAEQARRNEDWSKERDELIRELWNDGDGLSYRQIAARLEVKFSTVQAVFRGKGSGTTRPKVAKEDGP